MGLENFTLNMSQEACHFFTGMSLGGAVSSKIITWLFILYFVSKLARPTLDMWGTKLRDLIMKKRKKD